MNSPRPSPSVLGLVARGASLALARARFVLLVGIVLALMAYWPTIRLAFERLTHPDPFSPTVSSETEYWCPMCPGVVSDWPSKCPVCHMTLVRRLKGEMTPLPDGVVARVQLSPYRVQLAGIHAAVIEHRRLETEIALSGRLESPTPPTLGVGKLALTADVFANDIPLLTVGAAAEVRCDAAPGDTFAAQIESVSASASTPRVRLMLDDPRGRLRAGLFADARVRIPASRIDPLRDDILDRWRNRSTVELMTAGFGSSAAPLPSAALLDAAAELVMLNSGLMLAVPEAAVIDTGERKVVFVESMAGVYDAVEVRLGRRFGDFYALRSGLEIGQRVVTSGSVLLDAETRLNPSVAASYFGAGSRRAIPAVPSAPEALSPEERMLARRQKICPVTEADLDSMGGPVRVMVNGKPVFICCDGCRELLLKSPAKYLSKIDK